MTARVLAVILAGGQGRRIGGDKPGRMLAGRRLIDRAVDQARGWSDSVALSVRDPAQVDPAMAPIIPDDAEIAGPLGGLVAALRFAANSGREFVLTIPADMPFLPADLLERLSNELGSSACALASSGGHLHPVCALWRTSALNRVDPYLCTGRRSLKGFAEIVGYREIEWETSSRDPFFNINCAADLAEAERALA